MSLTSNFTYCVELGIASVREIFHLAFKNESDCFPHNIGPLTRTFGGHAATVRVTVLDDDDRPADLDFQDGKHIRFTLPFDVTVEVPDAPDPALSRITMSATVQLPGRLDTWTDAGDPVLGVMFDDVTAGDVTISDLTGLPTIDVGNVTAAIHSKYDTLPHRYTAPAPGGEAELLLYDGTRDTTLTPPAPGNPPITAAFETHSGTEYLEVVAPIHVDVPTGYGSYHYVSFGTITFWRAVTRTDTTISVAMGTEPGDPALATTVALDNSGPGHDEVVTQLTPLARSAVNQFGTITEPAFSTSAAEGLLRAEAAAYANPLQFALYTPQSPDPTVVLTTPVGFLLPADGVLAILLTRLHGTEADDAAPDNFLGGSELALAVCAEHVIKRSEEVIAARFPGVNDGGAEIHTDSGDATLKTVHAVPEDSGAHGESPGHIWITGEAEVHIDCWPDPDVSFEGPVFIDATSVETEDGCTLTLQPRAGEFDVDQSCCDVLLDLLIPVVGWIMLAVIESTIDAVGGQIAIDTANATTQAFDPIPKVVIGIAEIAACLTDLVISSQGFVFPGTISIRRAGRSFEDLEGAGSAPKPDHP